MRQLSSKRCSSTQQRCMHTTAPTRLLRSRGTVPAASTWSATPRIRVGPICSIYVAVRSRCSWPWPTWPLTPITAETRVWSCLPIWKQPARSVHSRRPPSDARSSGPRRGARDSRRAPLRPPAQLRYGAVSRRGRHAARQGRAQPLGHEDDGALHSWSCAGRDALGDGLV